MTKCMLILHGGSISQRQTHLTPTRYASFALSGDTMSHD